MINALRRALPRAVKVARLEFAQRDVGRDGTLRSLASFDRKHAMVHSRDFRLTAEVVGSLVDRRIASDRAPICETNSEPHHP